MPPEEILFFPKCLNNKTENTEHFQEGRFLRATGRREELGRGKPEQTPPAQPPLHVTKGFLELRQNNA